MGTYSYIQSSGIIESEVGDGRLVTAIVGLNRHQANPARWTLFGMRAGRKAHKARQIVHIISKRRRPTGRLFRRQRLAMDCPPPTLPSSWLPGPTAIDTLRTIHDKCGREIMWSPPSWELPVCPLSGTSTEATVDFMAQPRLAVSGRDVHRLAQQNQGGQFRWC